MGEWAGLPCWSRDEAVKPDDMDGGRIPADLPLWAKRNQAHKESLSPSVTSISCLDAQETLIQFVGLMETHMQMSVHFVNQTEKITLMLKLRRRLHAEREHVCNPLRRGNQIASSKQLILKQVLLLVPSLCI
ncbi:hypothetical protein lerEdw1_007433 [Lerista edwardsae]|nr:hypothetical protein lerEdw1_007434 [Lerista edwardsae]KAJ6650486.1 hypothetical protein lerEdw1_007433 [Lerista edwardsae]